ncbi:uncharacterized protein EI97DRAFT_449467 [Westerdykella ornata]|uniref:Tc1-like transposase DDE domain-containing protein n=1 Tax=Westerdykella ornata TaxID=318751 RepID=A0A6A6JNP0_WESOR|nr:uncharacterized protein EI97DRAFT_449467 [Westerdykella ornata]KAF2277286.1 hypothetical protein EI97DRAFT_449467 [Westerdykella ornata]
MVLSFWAGGCWLVEHRGTLENGELLGYRDFQILHQFGHSLKEISRILGIMYRQAQYADSCEWVTPKKRLVDEIELFIVSSQVGRLLPYHELAQSWVQSGRDRKQWVTCKYDEKLHSIYVIIRHQRKHGWMFWDSFHSNVKGSSLFWEKEWGTITGEAYAARILPIMESYIWHYYGGTLIFMQDNAPAHKYYLTMQELEHAKIMKDYIELKTGPNGNLSYLALRAFVQKAWEIVPSQLFENLIQSMPARMQAVIDAQDGHTKY